MSLHAEPLAKVFVSASTGRKVAALGAHHAKVALWQFLKAGIAVALRIAFLGPAPAVQALDGAGMAQMNLGAK